MKYRSGIAGRVVDQNIEHSDDEADLRATGLASGPAGRRLGSRYLTLLSWVAADLLGNQTDLSPMD